MPRAAWTARAAWSSWAIGRAEEGHESVAEELIDGALVPVDLGQHQLESAVHDSWTSSGSSLSVSAVKPETSTKSTVTSLRSLQCSP